MAALQSKSSGSPSGWGRWPNPVSWPLVSPQRRCQCPPRSPWLWKHRQPQQSHSHSNASDPAASSAADSVMNTLPTLSRLPCFLFRDMVRDFQRPSLCRFADFALPTPEPRSKFTFTAPSDSSRDIKSFYRGSHRDAAMRFWPSNSSSNKSVISPSSRNRLNELGTLVLLHHSCQTQLGDLCGSSLHLLWFYFLESLLLIYMRDYLLLSFCYSQGTAAFTLLNRLFKDVITNQLC